jgi:hypothetical protein
MFLLLALANAAVASTIAEAPLQPLSSLVGHCWRGEAPGGAGVDTHCFESLYAGHHVRDRHEVTVNGKTIYAGETVYSAEDGGVSFTYWNSLGGVGHGKAQAAGAEIVFSGEMREDPTSSPAPMHATWRMAASGYEVIWPDGTPHLMRPVK